MFNDEQLNAYYKMQQNVTYNPYELQAGAANYIHKNAVNLNRGGLDDTHLKFANLQLAQNGIVLPHLLTSLDDAK